jgi:hypothetical protein
MSTVEELLRFWSEDEALRALRLRASAPAKRELAERFLDRAGWKWLSSVSLLIDRCVLVEEDLA